MKRCPHCNQYFDDSNGFCLDDGTPLLSQWAPSPGAYISQSDTPTQVLPVRATRTDASSTFGASGSPWLYTMIGVLVTALIGAIAFIYVTRSPDTAQNPSLSTSTNNNIPPTANVAVIPLAAPESTPSRTAMANVPARVSTPGLSPAGNWTGDWSGKSAAFSATANFSENNGSVTGQIVWTLQRSANPTKADKVGLSATEYVSGTFDPVTRLLKVRGVRKDDPNNLVIYDNYNLSLSEDGRTMRGTSKNGVFSLRK